MLRRQAVHRIDRLPPPPAVPVRSPPVGVAGEAAERIEVPGGGPSLDARVHVPPAPERAVVICHPHPLYGGSMHSPVPLSIARHLGERVADRVAWARFDFRGVGASGGTYDDGRGETDDCLAVVAALRERAPGVPVSLCGHSFGSWIALRAAARDGAVDRVLLVAPSTRFFQYAADQVPRFGGPVTVFIGDRDEFSTVDEARALAEQLGGTVRVFEGFDHHFLKSRRALAEAALPVIVPEN
jgi:alpha/beta superfamily hydrolase